VSVPELSRLQPVDLREAWKNESADFTPWLASKENLPLLGEALGIELELESTEKSVGPFFADILCRVPGSDQWVLIENQLEQTDHTHLGQIITYAAGLNAVTVIWVARKFVEQHRAALDWLNEVTGEGTNFFGVEVELWRIGDSQMAPKFNVVSRPNSWVKQTRKPTGQAWDEASFFDALQKRVPAAVEPARAIVAWADTNMPDDWWGEGVQDGSFYPGLRLGSDWHMIASLWTYGSLEFQFQRMKLRPVFESEERRLELLRKLNADVGLQLPEDRVGVRPSVPLAQFSDPTKLAALLEVFDWYVAELRAGYAEG
jgi:hypothetical protein